MPDFVKLEVQFDLETKIDKLLKSYLILIVKSPMVLTVRILEIHVKTHNRFRVETIALLREATK